MSDLTFDFGDTPQPAPDTIGDALIEKRLIPNSFILDLNRGLTVPYDMELSYPWSLPSRLFRFPIEVTDQEDGGERRIGLLHPLLADHPFVKQVETALGFQIDPEGAPNEFGYSKAPTGQWWHAVDLVSSGHWRELLDTARFTTSEHIAGAVSYGLRYSSHRGKAQNGHISTAQAREIMAALDAPDPGNLDAIIDEHYMRPSPCKSEKGVITWPVNEMARDSFTGAWGQILGIETGYFAHNRAGFLNWTDKGRDRFPPTERLVAPKSIEPPVFQKAVKSKAEEIASRPVPATAAQLDLF